MVKIENLTKYYGKNRAVNNISFTIEDNEILGFLGPNGAGKSTTMNMIAGCLPMTSGSISIFGSDIAKEPVKAKKNIGYLPEIPPVYPDMRVNEYLSFCAGLKRVPATKRSKEIKRVTELLGLTEVRTKLIKNLSKGYKQRVGFAQALIGNPKFLILDEPTVGLDPNQLAEVRSIIKDLKSQHSVIFSSHILSEVSAVCDRVVIINKGNIKAVDTIDNLEKSLGGNPIINIRVKGPKAKSASVIELTEGVKEISKIEAEGGESFLFSVQTDGDADDIRTKIMSELIKNDIQITEIFTEKPDLEKVFMAMLNKDDRKSGLEQLLEETPEISESSEEKSEKEETEKEEGEQ